MDQWFLPAGCPQVHSDGEQGHVRRFDRGSGHHVSWVSHMDDCAQVRVRGVRCVLRSAIGGAAPFPTSWSTPVSKRTFQPNNRRRAKVHGFRLRMRTRAGRAIVTARRRKGRRTLTA